MSSHTHCNHSRSSNWLFRRYRNMNKKFPKKWLSSASGIMLIYLWLHSDCCYWLFKDTNGLFNQLSQKSHYVLIRFQLAWFLARLMARARTTLRIFTQLWSNALGWVLPSGLTCYCSLFKFFLHRFQPLSWNNHESRCPCEPRSQI